MISIYVASPLGFSEVGNAFMKSEIFPVIKKLGYIILDPWNLTDSKLIDSAVNLPYGLDKKNKWQEINPIIGCNNARAIKECTGVFAVLDGTDVDSGTASEIGYAAALGKPILGYRGDFRLSSDNDGSIVNLQVEYFTKLNGGKIITQISDLEKELKNIFN